MSLSLPWPGVVDAYRGEWIKACTVASTGWLLAGTAVSGIGLSAVICSLVHYQPGSGQDPTKLALSGIQLAQALIAIWAVRVVTDEYRSRLIHITLTATPQRCTILAAKFTVVTILAMLASAITVAGSLLTANILLAANGFTAAQGRPLLLDVGPVIRAGIGSTLYLALIALLAMGTAFLVRDSAAAGGTVLGLLYLFPLGAQLSGNATWQRHLQQVGPTTAGLNIEATTSLHTLAMGPWAGLTVLVAWTAGSLVVGGLAFCLRDS